MAPRAAARLRTLGVDDVREYRAGKLDWLAAGLPTEGDNSTRPRAGIVCRKDVATTLLAGDSGPTDVDTVVVDEERVVLGLLRAGEAEMTEGPSTFRPYVPIQEMADYMKEHDLGSAPITTSDGKLVGLLYRDDAIRAAEGCPGCARKMI
jgi:CBS domain-containing protein